jgi:hypothetical protein
MAHSAKECAILSFSVGGNRPFSPENADGMRFDQGHAYQTIKNNP